MNRIKKQIIEKSQREKGEYDYDKKEILRKNRIKYNKHNSSHKYKHNNTILTKHKQITINIIIYKCNTDKGRV